MNNESNDPIIVAKALEKTVKKGPGTRLRDARLKANLSIEQVASKLFLTKSLINAIEQDDYQSTPGVTFIRGYLRAYAKLVNLSADDIVASFESLGVIDSQHIASTDILYKNPKPSKSLSERGLRWMTVGVVLFLMALMVTWWRNHNEAVINGKVVEVASHLPSPAVQQSAKAAPSIIKPSIVAETEAVDQLPQLPTPENFNQINKDTVAPKAHLRHHHQYAKQDKPISAPF